MKFYSFDEIKARGNCIRFVEDVLGERVIDGRCRASWRNGTNPQSVSVSEKEFYDFSEEQGGGIIELCARAKFGGDIQQAQDFLGDWLRLEPKMGLVKGKKFSQYDKLISEGYKEVTRYYYKDESGETRHIVVRMEHPDKGKSFVQETPHGAGVKDVELVLYNLPVIVKSPWIVIVEGEKDADTLIKWTIPSTTNAGGSKKWQDGYNRYFDGKDVIICRDNDDAGLGHAKLVARNLANVAKTIRMICPSNLHKGDVTDWTNKEGGTKELFLRMIKNAPVMSKEEALWSDDEIQLMRAKDANITSFSNTHTITKLIDGHDKRVEEPYTMEDLTKQVHERFLGFPRRIGDGRMFDYDRDSNRIEWIDNKASLFAWMGQKSKHVIHWNGKTSGAVGKDELYEGLFRASMRYESISLVPDWPKRPDVFYSYRDKVVPSENHACFDGLMQFFNPANESSKTLLRVMFAAPIYYRYGVPRPCWIIDSESGPGVGKTTVAELLGTLYKCSPIATSQHELKFDFKELLKRIISSEGRSSRILLVDNVTGVFNDIGFAKLVTGFGISGKAPYGRGEETRPNNLTYIITSNSANITDEIASRAFMIMLSKPKYSKSWARDVMRYIETNRFTILGDIIDIISNQPSNLTEAFTRMPEFEQEVLRPMCRDEAEYKAAIDGIMTQRDDANIDKELARQCGEILAYKLDEESLGDVSSKCHVAFIRSEIIDDWVGKLNIKMQDVRNFAKTGLLDNIDKEIKRYPDVSSGPRGKLRSAGLMWIGDDVTFDNFTGVRIIAIGEKGRPTIKATLDDAQISEQLKQREWLKAEHSKKQLLPVQAFDADQEDDQTNLLPF